jgi:cellulose synthase/poly-beta-1,6-N-acetylglucosamine synthase-like glycosyltransferase
MARYHKNLKKKIPITIVCASHKGREKLPLLINSIYKNTFWPDEIIICGTQINDFDLINIKKYRKLSIKKLVSKIKSQKYQRKKAQNCAKNNIILQLDDDLILKNNFIERMFLHFKNNNGKKVVCALILIKTKKRKSIAQSYRWNYFFYTNFIFRFVLRLFNFGKKIKFYSILPSGRICPLLPKNFYNSKKVISGIEWTNSTICYEKSAIKDAVSDIDLKEKKSYYEDVIFSHSLYNKGYKLLIDRNIVAYHPEFKSLNIEEHIKTLKAQFFIVKNFKKSYVLFFLDVLLATTYLLFKRILINK